MSQLKAVIHRSLQNRKLGYWESPGVIGSGTKAPATISLDNSYAELVVVFDRISDKVKPEWTALAKQLKTLETRVNELAEAPVDNNTQARDDHRQRIEEEIEMAKGLEIDIAHKAAEVEAARLEELARLAAVEVARLAAVEEARLRQAEALRRKQQQEEFTKENYSGKLAANRERLKQLDVPAERGPIDALLERLEPLYLNDNWDAARPLFAELQQKMVALTVLVKTLTVKAAGDKSKIYDDETLGFTAEAGPVEATNKAVAWSVSNPAIAKINAAGLLTPTKTAFGKVTVTATARDASVRTATLDVTISPQVEKIAAEVAKLSSEVFDELAKGLSDMGDKDAARLTAAKAKYEEKFEIEDKVYTAGELTKAKEALMALREEIPVAISAQEEAAGEEFYEDVKPQYEAIMALDPKTVENSAGLIKLQEKIQDLWDGVLENRTSKEWLEVQWRLEDCQNLIGAAEDLPAAPEPVAPPPVVAVPTVPLTPLEAYNAVDKRSNFRVWLGALRDLMNANGGALMTDPPRGLNGENTTIEVKCFVRGIANSSFVVHYHPFASRARPGSPYASEMHLKATIGSRDRVYTSESSAAWVLAAVPRYSEIKRQFR